MKKIHKILGLIEGLFSLDLINNAYNYPTPMDNVKVIDTQVNNQDNTLDSNSTKGTYLSYNTIPTEDSTDNTEIQNKDRNYITDKNILSYIKSSVYEGIGNFEENNNQTIEVETLQVTQDESEDLVDVFKVELILENDLEKEDVEKLISEIKPIVEDLDVGLIKVDYDPDNVEFDNIVIFVRVTR